MIRGMIRTFLYNELQFSPTLDEWMTFPMDFECNEMQTKIPMINAEAAEA